jgi:Tol biopolymer transport system component
LDGTLYLADISRGPGRERLAIARPVDGVYHELIQLKPPINTDGRCMSPFVSPDENYVIYQTARPSESVSKILAISYRKEDGSWHEPQEIDLGMNAGLPFVSPDGQYLFFTGGEQGRSDIYWVSAAFIEELRPED